jgi:hypothetical protein
VTFLLCDIIFIAWLERGFLFELGTDGAGVEGWLTRVMFAWRICGLHFSFLLVLMEFFWSLACRVAFLL